MQLSGRASTGGVQRALALPALLALTVGCSAAGPASPPAGSGEGGRQGVPSTATGGGAVVPNAGGAPIVLISPTSGGATSGGAPGGPEIVATDCDSTIVMIVRDFAAAHSDFERNEPIEDLIVGAGISVVPNITGPQLDQGFPVYGSATGRVPTTTGPLEFYHWFVDTPGMNLRIEVELPLTEISTGRFVYDNAAFFPIDGQGFGNEGNPHNYHFTTEVRTRFTYNGGETFTFRGDDDLWMFVNGHRVIDLGGTHPPAEATVNMDQLASGIGLQRGQSYPMDIFHAERHTTGSNYRIETTISCFEVVEPPPPPPPPVIQ